MVQLTVILSMEVIHSRKENITDRTVLLINSLIMRVFSRVTKGLFHRVLTLMSPEDCSSQQPAKYLLQSNYLYLIIIASTADESKHIH